ncbi:MAG: sigma-70 family RNA polymerase sigma factor [Actinomycetota bacterium]
MEEEWKATAELVGDAREGSQQAWDALVERFAPLVVGVARSFRLSPVDVDDVVQVVWIRLVEHLDKIREPERLAGWIKTTARNESLRVSGQRTAEELPVIALDDDTAEQVVKADLLAQLLDGLERLGDRCRQLLHAIFVREHPYSQISTEFDMPVGSIGPTRQRCLTQLRGVMGGRVDA